MQCTAMQCNVMQCNAMQGAMLSVLCNGDCWCPKRIWENYLGLYIYMYIHIYIYIYTQAGSWERDNPRTRTNNNKAEGTPEPQDKTEERGGDARTPRLSKRERGSKRETTTSLPEGILCKTPRLPWEMACMRETFIFSPALQEQEKQTEFGSSGTWGHGQF